MTKNIDNEKLSRMNILVLGKTGVGKSTLINSLFGEELTNTGYGKPITQNICKIEKENYPISLYDTPGIELKGEHSAENLLNDVSCLIQNGLRSNDIEHSIHCILYCINTTSNRIEETEKIFLQKLTESTQQCNTPIILVLTQAFAPKKAETMRNEVQKARLPVCEIISLLAQDYPIDDGHIVKAHGLNNLVEVISNVLPEAIRNTFIAIQIVNLDAKRASAKKIVTTTAIAAAVTGATPIPFSDAMILVPAQMSMLIHITNIYHIPIKKAELTILATLAINTLGTTIIGKTIVSNILKFIPGVGTVVGGTISATTAATLTTALGNTYIDLMTRIAKGEMKTTDISTKESLAMFKQQFKAQMNVKKTNRKLLT